MSNEEALFAAVVEAAATDPNSDTERLVYADAVQDRDEQLAALIRGGVLCECVGELITAYPNCGLCEGRRWRPRCQAVECRNAGCKYTLPTYDDPSPEDVIDECFCGEHAAEAGYCRGCGGFWAGIEAFDFHRSGLCPECREPEEDPFDDYDLHPDYL